MNKMLALLLVLSLLLSGCVAGTVDDPAHVDLANDDRVIMQGQTNEGDDRVPLVDTVSNALVGISFTHSQVHIETSFLSDFVDETLAAGENITLAFKTPGRAIRIHLLVQFSTLVGGDIQVWEDVTWSTGGGTLNPIYNRFRETTTNPSVLLEDLTATPSFTATDNTLRNPGINTVGATSLHHIYTWGAKNKLLAGSARDTEEIVLKPNSLYGVTFTSGADANKAQLILNWYELTVVSE